MFKKKTQKESLSKAALIASQYSQLSTCCNVLSKVKVKVDSQFLDLHTGGWRLHEYEIVASGIDIDQVYSYIEKLAQKRKIELEIELQKLEE